MLTRRGFFRRAVGALAAGTLAGVSRWLPAPKAEDRLVLPEPVPLVVERDWQWYSDTNVMFEPATRETFMAVVDYEMKHIKQGVLAEMDRRIKWGTPL